MTGGVEAARRHAETVARVAAAGIAGPGSAPRTASRSSPGSATWATSRSEVDGARVTRADVDANDVRCPDAEAAAAMEARIREVRRANSVGAASGVWPVNVPAGWGELLAGKLEADLAHAMLSPPASKGFEIGSGFEGTRLRGSEHNDAFVLDGERVATASNRSGGVRAGSPTERPLRCASPLKPVATIFRAQQTVTADGEETTFAARGPPRPLRAPPRGADRGGPWPPSRSPTPRSPTARATRRRRRGFCVSSAE